MTVFADILTRRDVEEAVLTHLQAWMPTYIAEVERQAGWAEGRLIPIRNYTLASSRFEKPTEDTAPTVLVQATGLAGRPERKGDGSIKAPFAIGVGVITVGGGTDPRADARETSGAYGAAARALMIQHQAVGGIAESVLWRDERYDEVPSESERSLGVQLDIFEVLVPGVVNRHGGVAEPLDNPYEPPAEWPTVETTETEVSSEG